MSAEAWKLENDLCRCCHAEGSFKNLGEPNYNRGQTELFTEMLRNCFDIEMNAVDGAYSSTTFTICEVCIVRLRDASNFKHQVLLCEERFKDMYRNIKELNIVQVKLESESSSDEGLKGEDMAMSDDGAFDLNFGDDDDDDEKTVLQIKLEDAKKAKGKGKAKPKPAPKAKKAVTKKVSPQKPKPSKPKAAESKAEDESKPKKGGKRYAGRFVLKETDYKQDGEDFFCTHCEKKYDKIFSLRFHIKTKHYKIPRFTCQYCGKAFMTPTPLTKHKLEEHNLDERAKCKACNAAFNTKVQLRKHINNFHMLGEKYKCESCEYESFSFESMYKHKFKHKTVKDYHCRYCRKAFLRKATLDLHERIHTGDRRKVCKVCGQAFVQKASLNYHMTKYHPEVNF